ncbi:anti-sigma factor [Streptomyces durbertensis]|uniref:Regulator of SigK n=1 Tax=Streptomyces durbertensis TaxID=2448886 RepID=A0ABR6EMU7_9ACTN|nr:anti-sigma factor [Streptomyces durbertensis]MBB1246664.1 anti-sigma factor [Streptomyces durbertensis]
MKQHEDVHTLAAAYALNALAADERDAFAAHLGDCEACRLEAAEFEATAARLAAAAAQPPPAAMKERVMSSVDGVRQLPPRLSATTTPVRPRGPLRRQAAAFAIAAAVAAAASFGGLAAWQYQQGERARDQAAQAEERLRDISAVLTADDARTVRGRTTNGATTTIVASRAHDMAVLTASGLPAPASGAVYQLWLDHDGTMLPAGFLHGDGAVLVEGDTSDASAVGLTLEPAGGSEEPTTTPLLLMPMPG